MKRINDIEFKYSELNKKYELVQWIKNEEKGEFCIVIAFFNKGSDGCNIEFIGSRPFNSGESKTVWSMLKYGQTIVDADCELKWEISE